MDFVNNPFNTLKEIMEEHYPTAKCLVYIGESLTDGEEAFGCTLFPEDKSEIPMIEIHHSLSITDSVEVLAHELAHVVAGEEADHSEEWEKVFTHIHEEFQRKVDEQFAEV